MGAKEEAMDRLRALTTAQLLDEIGSLDNEAGHIRNHLPFIVLRERLEGQTGGNYQVEDGWVETLTGTKFYFLSPTTDMIHVEDIAGALSQQCRYNGHTAKHYGALWPRRRFLSVAEHCVKMYQRCLELNPGDHRLAACALMHDGAEAYISDLVRPLKHVLPDFRRIEHGIDWKIKERFGLAYEPWPQAIKEYDARIIVDERRQALSDSDHTWGTDGLEPLDVKFDFWSPERAEAEFLGAFMDLVDGNVVSR